MRVLVVEDDGKIASFIVNGLKQNGFSVDSVADGEAALAHFRTVPYDAAVVDVMLPKRDGLSVLGQLRQEKNAVPVLILSARASVENRVAGLEAGGDDYLTKPFAFAELLARVHALIRRATHVVEPTRLACGDLSMDLLNRDVMRAGQRIELQNREFALLELLLRNPDRPVTKTMILEHLWDYSFDPQTNVVDVHISKLRQKIDCDFERPLLRTVRNAGYMLTAKVDSPD